MTSQRCGEEQSLERLLRALLVAMLCMLAASTAMAKEVTLTAIELFDGPSGATYVLLNSVTINGKTEMRACRPCQESPIDKLTYSKLDKFQLTPGGKLERTADGALRWTATEGGEAFIVAPLNVKYEGKPALSPSDLADQALLKAVQAGASADAAAAPGLIRGVVLVFVAGPDVELAEYLRARRASDIPSWQAYLSKYPSSPHLADAKMRLAVLLAGAGQTALAEFKKQAVTDTTDYAGLKSAKSLHDQAKTLSPGAAGQAELDSGIKSSLGDIADQGRVELDAYRAAVKNHSTGYVHLAAARKYAEIAEGIQSTPKGSALQGDVDQDTNTVQVAIRQAESAAVAKQFEQAMVFIGPYRMFAGEERRIQAIIDSGYAYHMEKGKTNSDTATWLTAISEFEKADAIKDTPEVRDLLANARAQQVLIEDKQAAAKALADSAEYEQAKDIIHAYETLDDLPLAQRRLVTDTIERLKPDYVQRSSQLAKELRTAHRPIRGLSDEVGIETAYVYLQRAYKLSENEAFKDQMDVLSDDLSAYLLEQAKHYLAKPSGSGTEIGWTYLAEAREYKASNLEAVRDAMFSATQAHAFRSKISIRVQFRDQTSQRDSPGFSAQLGDAVISGLESSKIPVKVVRAGEVTPVEPDYQLEGDVLRHHLTMIPVIEAMESKYSPTTREVPNEDWNKANRAYEKATMELQTAQQALQGAEAKGNKPEVKVQTQTIKEAEKAVEDAHVLLDSTPKTRTEDVIRPYSYSKKTVTLTGSIQLQFRIADSFADEQGEIVPITRDDHKSYVVLENVKAEDTEGVKAVGTEIDQNEFMAASETAAMEALVAAVSKRVEALPVKIYDTAKSREAGSDLDGAAEAYLRFLEVSPPDPKSPEQQHARQFLKDQFNMQPVSSVAP